MAKFNVDVSGLDEIARKVSDYLVPRIVEEVGQELLSTVEQKTPRQTGHLASNWTMTVNGESLTIENDTPYATFVVDGTKPHEILPKNASVLAFQINGTTVFAKRVHHPGTSPNPFVDESINLIESQIDNIVAQAIREAGL